MNPPQQKFRQHELINNRYLTSEQLKEQANLPSSWQMNPKLKNILIG